MGDDEGSRGADASPEQRDTGPSPAWSPTVTTLVALSLAVLFFWLSLTPSLMPRSGFFQGVIGGASAAFGYALGLVVVRAWRFFLERPAPGEASRPVALAVALIASVGTVLVLVRHRAWQRELRELMGVELVGWAHPFVVIAVALLVFVLVVALARVLRWVYRRLDRVVSRVVPRRVSALIAAVAVLALTFGILNGVVIDNAVRALDASFAQVNGELEPDTPQPAAAEVSGSPESLVTWESLGRQGRRFMAGATSVDDLEAFSGRPASQPVRAYAGIASADDIESTAELAVDDLERAGGFDRAVLSVVTTTGTGWVNENSAVALEYLYNGDTAQVSMQYSYLPSPLSFLIDQGRARAAGRALFEAVYARWEQLPQDERPLLVVAGESLGSFGGETPFGSAADMRARIDGALFVGPPFMSDLWREYVDNRDPGSPEWLPVYEEGRTVRFAARPDDLGRPTGEWGDTRVVYLQHPSDPVVWFDFSLAVRKPDWLEEERGYDVLPSTRWFPFVTFLQVAADLALAEGVPPGHGHQYGADPANGWAAVLQPQGWGDDDTERLREVLLVRDQ
ncbi:alpha/beta hydrolase [Ornithinimicrobium sediminis]|uniref:alpha/beta hydrolase n=1 Tax=Ornithinimicrobium sediminis TaxID=2904603 RepID=UPI001E649B50|nr:alpha/beta-hydrolase family protein [Ornithinimicrobium sediminis]MCE0485534.1 alpha/beta-hydrolase family protein [Ornithinimicrobium sediminis]